MSLWCESDGGAVLFSSLLALLFAGCSPRPGGEAGPASKEVLDAPLRVGEAVDAGAREVPPPEPAEAGPLEAAAPEAPAPAEPVSISAGNRSIDQLAERLGATAAKVEVSCVEGTGPRCGRFALDGLFERLEALAAGKRRTVRILQLGDSHIAADYITRTARARLQKRFGDAGRGFVHPDQRADFGGRRKERQGQWERLRMVDPGTGGEPLGFAGIAVESRRAGDSARFALEDDAQVEVFFRAEAKGAVALVRLEGKTLATLETTGEADRTRSQRLRLPARSQDDRRSSRRDPRELEIEARVPGFRLLGISFTSGRPGVLYDAVGPVGADAWTYLSVQEASFTQAVQLISPDLVIIMLGGNDSLRLRQGRAELQEVGEAMGALIERVRAAAPEADCMLWSPMDAGERRGGKIVSKSQIEEVRRLQQQLSRARGCAYWDTYGAMGGHGSMARWFDEGIINEDLIHPRYRAGLLLGHLFSTALFQAYDERSSRASRH